MMASGGSISREEPSRSSTNIGGTDQTTARFRHHRTSCTHNTQGRRSSCWIAVVARARDCPPCRWSITGNSNTAFAKGCEIFDLDDQATNFTVDQRPIQHPVRKIIHRAQVGRKALRFAFGCFSATRNCVLSAVAGASTVGLASPAVAGGVGWSGATTGPRRGGSEARPFFCLTAVIRRFAREPMSSLDSLKSSSISTLVGTSFCRQSASAVRAASRKKLFSLPSASSSRTTVDSGTARAGISLQASPPRSTRLSRHRLDQPESCCLR